jgi:hypothetical protein
MASTIKLKNGSGEPLATDLVTAEPAFDLTNKRLYTEDSGGTVIEVGTNPTEIQIDNINIDGNTISSTDTDGDITLDPNGAGGINLSADVDVTGTVTADGLTVDTDTLYVDATNDRVGIGTSSPSAPLMVLGTSDNTTVARFGGSSDSRSLVYSTANQSDGASNPNALHKFQVQSSVGQYKFSNTANDILFLDYNGNVGIGTDSPSGELHINSTGGGTDLIIQSDSDQSGGVYFNDGSNSGAVFYTHSSNDMVFRTNGSEAMRIDSSGNLGIGTTSPAETLHIQSAVPVIRLEDTGHNGYSEIIGSTTGSLRFSADVTNVDAGSYVGFEVDGSERMRIDSSGNVGIGTTSPSTDLHIASATGGVIRLERDDTDITTDDSLGSIEFYQKDPSENGVGVVSKIESLNNNSYAGYGALAFSTGNSASITERMRIDSSGNVGIGTDSPDTPLHVKSPNSAQTDAETVLSIGGNGDWTTGGAVKLYMSGIDSDNRGAYIQSEITSGGNAHDLSFGVSANGATPSEAMRIDSSGNLDLTNGGGNIIMASGAGIDFSATANSPNGTMSNELLDDYEEGTWTAGVSQGTIVSANGYYRKVGSLVTVYVFVSTFSDRSTAQNINITGLPFAQDTGADDNCVGSCMWRNVDEEVQGVYINGFGNLECYGSPTGTYDGLKYADLNSTDSSGYITATYIAA